MNAVAARFRSHIDDGVSNALGFCEKDFFFARDAEGQRVNQRILRIARLETDFAADGRDAETISVMRDAANHAIENATILGSVFFACAFSRSDLAEAKRIEYGDGTRAHGEDVAQNSADARRSALKRFDVARMIVRFYFERGDEPIADVHNAGVFARTLHHEFAARGQALQVHFARLIGAVLAPHHTENTEFGDVGVAAENLLDARVLVARNAVFGGDFRSHFDFGASGS